jgi:predicted small lipoprotein YifL
VLIALFNLPEAAHIFRPMQRTRLVRAADKCFLLLRATIASKIMARAAPKHGVFHPPFVYSGGVWSPLLSTFLSRLGAIAFFVSVAFLLPSCGRRGPVELPPDASVSAAPLTGAPGDYQPPADPSELSGQSAVNPTTETSSGPAKHSPIRPPPRPFFLDPLL